MQAHVVDMTGTSSLRENRRHRQRAKTKSKRKAEDKKKEKKRKIYIFIKIEALTCVYLWDCLSLLTSCKTATLTFSHRLHLMNHSTVEYFFFRLFPLILFVPSSSIDVQFLQDC